MFPVWDDQVHEWHTPYFSWIFLAINCLVFAYQLTLSPEVLETFYYTYWSVPSVLLWWEQLYTLITNMFLHGWWSHILGNMFFLYVFADNIEATIWNFKFLLFYIAWWLAASAGHILFNMWSAIPAIWASWAIAAVLWAYLVMFPKANIKLINTQTMNATLVPASYFLWLWIVQQFTSWVWSLASATWWWWVAWWAHIWWFVFGWAAWLYKWKYSWKMTLQKWSEELLAKKRKQQGLWTELWQDQSTRMPL